ncbi:Tetrapyrrole-binding protein [Durusdinium trenchii]|uniref:Chloroplastic (Genomes uncoupled 4) n=1 Tax=Durusdinium trenchii TaxID=1381693 RepID=A0ABP0J9H6_9DINO
MSKRTTLTGAPSRDTGLSDLEGLLSLEQCLAEHRFEEADQITRDLLLIFGGPEPLQRGYLKPEEVAQISEEELRRVDELWSLHSAGRFGYAAQRRRLEEAGHDFSEFMQRVGWLRSEQGHEEQLLRFWPRRDFEYSLEAPEGHLPLTNLIRGRDLLVSLLQHPAFSSNGARQGVAPPPPRKSVNEANEEEVRSWWAKLIGAADEEEEETPHEDTSTAAERSFAESFEERQGDTRFRITMITGFESFNARLYRNAAREAILPGLSVCVFTDQDIVERREVVQQVLRETDVFFCSLIFDFDQAEWLREQCQDIKVRMIFESAVELMSCTQVGSFQMGGGGGGMPPQIRSMISALTGQREEGCSGGSHRGLYEVPESRAEAAADASPAAWNW